MKSFTKLLLILVLTGFYSCGDTILNDDLENTIEIPSYTNMIAATILTFNSSINRYEYKLLLIDYDDPGSYQFVLDESITPYAPKFSPDGSKIFFRDLPKNSTNDGRDFGTLDVNNGVVYCPYPTDLYILDQRQYFCWMPDGSGFYFTTPDRTLSYGYDINELKGDYILDLNNITPVANYEADKIIGFTNDGKDVDSNSGYYILDSELNIVEKLENSYIHIDENPSTGWAMDLSYNNDNQLFAFSIWKEGTSGFTIGITDKGGTVYQSMTSGDYLDTKPVWGPDGDTVLFLRIPLGSYIPGNTNRLMKVTISTGVVEEILNFENVEGAFGFSGMDFAAY